MGLCVCGGAALQCSFGNTPGNLMVLPVKKVLAGLPVANITDNKPLVNIMPFGMCMSPSNPQVAAATAAALGVLTPMPCIPIITAPWFPGSGTVMVGNMPALNNSSKALCNWGGIIQVVNPGQTTVQVP